MIDHQARCSQSHPTLDQGVSFTLILANRATKHLSLPSVQCGRRKAANPNPSAPAPIKIRSPFMPCRIMRNPSFSSPTRSVISICQSSKNRVLVSTAALPILKISVISTRGSADRCRRARVLVKVSPLGRVGLRAQESESSLRAAMWRSMSSAQRGHIHLHHGGLSNAASTCQAQYWTP